MKQHHVFTRDTDTSSNVYFSIVMFVLRGCMCFFPENITQQDMKNEQRVWTENHASIAKIWEWLQGSNIIPLRRQQQRQPATSNKQQPTKIKLPQKTSPNSQNGCDVHWNSQWFCCTLELSRLSRSTGKMVVYVCTAQFREKTCGIEPPLTPKQHLPHLDLPRS